MVKVPPGIGSISNVSLVPGIASVYVVNVSEPDAPFPA